MRGGRFRQKLKLIRRGCRITREEQDSLRQMVNYELEFFRNCFTDGNIPAISITVYGQFNEFLNCQKSTPKYARSDYGFYDVDTKEITVYKDADFLSTCYHEISHFFLGTFFRIAPEWLDEGIAEYFEGAMAGKNGIRISDRTWQLKRIRKLIRRNRIRIKRLVGLSYKKFHKRRELNNYALSWGIIHLLMYLDPRFVTEIINQLRAKKNAIESINAVYPGGILQLQKDFVIFYK